MTHVPDDPLANDDLASWIGDIVEDSWDQPDLDADADTDPGVEADVDVDGPLFGADDLDDDALLVDAETSDDGLDGIRLDDDAGDDAVGDPTDGTAPEIRLGDPDDDGLHPHAHEGTLGIDALVGIAGDLQGAEPGAGTVEAILDRLGLDDAYLGVAGRGAALVLQELGVDAHVSHGTVEELADRLEGGGRVLVTGADGARLPVIEVDFGRGELVVDADGGPRRVDLGSFMGTWSAASFEMVVAGDDVVLPVAIDGGGM